MDYTPKPAASRARTLALWTIVLVAISNISVLTSMGLVEFLARTFIIGGIIALFVFFVAWGIMAVMDRSKSN
jgi:hypothetical protein